MANGAATRPPRHDTREGVGTREQTCARAREWKRWALALHHARDDVRALLATSSMDAAYTAISAMPKDKLGSVVCFEPLVVR